MRSLVVNHYRLTQKGFSFLSDLKNKICKWIVRNGFTLRCSIFAELIEKINNNDDDHDGRWLKLFLLYFNLWLFKLELDECEIRIGNTRDTGDQVSYYS